MQKFGFRYEIDFFRCIAIIFVLLFHFFPITFSYGYIGVDIFFVISGYLLACNFVNGSINNFSTLVEYFKKRITRILPLTTFFLMVITVVAVLVFVSSDLFNFFDSLNSSLLFYSNFFFWRTGGYFGASDALKPLLHMWSLSVEEQIYFLLPIFLLYLFRNIQGELKK